MLFSIPVCHFHNLLQCLGDFQRCMYANTCEMLFNILIFFFESADKINRLPQKHRGHTLLFVISSLESLLPLHKKKGSVQSTLFFMSNAKQMWPSCGDSHCKSLCSHSFLSLCLLILCFDIC